LAASLKPKLQERGLLESESIETEIKGLAGARLIFYTNTDVDRFLNSRLIPENFQIDREATKIHHPTKENEGVRYQAIHYTGWLSEERAKLPEYAKFKGMRCEIQIQSILNHAWSETSHDIIYKNKPRGGFGSKAMKSIANRFNQIMDRYLLPAGYEFQRVQHDYERLQQGKELFDRDAIRTLEAAKSNNERHELLSSLKEHGCRITTTSPQSMATCAARWLRQRKLRAPRRSSQSRRRSAMWRGGRRQMSPISLSIFLIPSGM